MNPRRFNAREGFVEHPDFVTLTSHLPEPIADVAWFAYLMGWRREQVLSLTWADVNRAAGTVIRRVEFNKTKKPSVLPLSASVRMVIERRRQARLVADKEGPRVCDLVFHRGGQPIKDFRGAWRSACIKAGLAKPLPAGKDGKTRWKPINLFHDLRRCTVRNLENAGTPRKVAKSITGHLTDAVYERYHIVKEEDQRTALERVEARLASDPHNGSHDGPMIAG